MKARTLPQPYASLVASGVVKILTSARHEPHRGRIAIHAGASQPRQCAVGDWKPYRTFEGSWVAQHHARGEPMAPDDIDLPLGVIVATADLVDCIRIVGDYERPPDGKRCIRSSGLEVFSYVGMGTRTGPYHVRQRPYGDFTPGRWAWMLGDVEPTTERCPLCMGSCEHPDSRGDSYNGHIEPGSIEPCPMCWVTGPRPLGKCDPIPAKGRQGLWQWTP